jgi:ferric-dicitrate binding protein FerR (iron transport regulator)
MIYPKDKKILKRFRNTVFEKLSRKEKKALWRRIEASFGDETGKRISISSIAIKAAASIALLAALSYFMKEIGNQNVEEAKSIMVETGIMERKRLVLPDSSIVWLNAGSRLEYPETFARHERDLKLSGEAYFDVRRDEGRKFLVRTGDIVVTVLGTQFAVINYPNEKLAEVVLASGKVCIDGVDEENSEFKLLPGERFAFHKTTNQRILEKVDISLYTNWLDDKLNFDNAELGYIIKNLERWYEVSFECPPSMETRYRLTFTLKNESLEHTLKMMADIAPLQFEKTPTGIAVREKIYNLNL